MTTVVRFSTSITSRQKGEYYWEVSTVLVVIFLSCIVVLYNYIIPFAFLLGRKYVNLKYLKLNKIRIDKIHLLLACFLRNTIEDGPLST